MATTPAFMTGSRVYGTPKNDSDIDLVVYMPPTALADFQKAIDALPWLSRLKVLGVASGDHKDPTAASFRFGPLNLIVETTEKMYETWAEGTNKLYDERPVSKERAIVVLDRLREAARKE